MRAVLASLDEPVWLDENSRDVLRMARRQYRDLKLADYTQVTARPSVFGESFEGPMPGHEPGMPWHYDKHVWVWETNPNGMFSQWNPSISCN